MARLHPEPYAFERTPGRTPAWQEELKELERLIAESDKVPEGQVKGVVVDFPVADGKATYLVIKERPLTLQHIDFFDGYQVPAAHIRGLEKDDILQQRAFRKAMTRVASKQA